MIRPHRLEDVKSAIASQGVSGMTVSDVRGVGTNVESSSWMADEQVVALPIKSQIEVVCEDELVETIVESILAQARTGEPGDGKIFLERIEDAVRIRTFERGDLAI